MKWSKISLFTAAAVFMVIFASIHHDSHRSDLAVNSSLSGSHRDAENDLKGEPKRGEASSSMNENELTSFVSQEPTTEELKRRLIALLSADRIDEKELHEILKKLEAEDGFDATAAFLVEGLGSGKSLYRGLMQLFLISESNEAALVDSYATLAGKTKALDGAYRGLVTRLLFWDDRDFGGVWSKLSKMPKPREHEQAIRFAAQSSVLRALDLALDNAFKNGDPIDFGGAKNELKQKIIDDLINRNGFPDENSLIQYQLLVLQGASLIEPQLAYQKLTQMDLDKNAAAHARSFALFCLGGKNVTLATELVMEHGTVDEEYRTVGGRWARASSARFREYIDQAKQSAEHRNELNLMIEGYAEVQIGKLNGFDEAGRWIGELEDQGDLEAVKRLGEFREKIVKRRVMERGEGALQDIIDGELGGVDSLQPAFRSWLLNEPEAAHQWYQKVSDSITPEQEDHIFASLARYSAEVGEDETSQQWVEKIKDDRVKNPIISELGN